VRNVSLYIFFLLTALASESCLAASPLLAVYQKSEYPAPGNSYSYPPGLLFEVCADGSIYRALGHTKGSGPEQGSMSKSALKGFRAGLESEWLAPVRAECKARGVTVDAAYLRIEAVSGEEFECSLYEEGEALKQFESKFSALQLENSQPAKPRLSSACN
jgi:hypothetical protein